MICEGNYFKGRRMIACIYYELRELFEIIKCSVMSDGWTNEKEKSIMSFLVNCPRRRMFIKFVDASAYVNDAQFLDNFI